MISRRELIGKAAVGATAAAFAVGAARTALGSTRAVPAAKDEPAHDPNARHAAPQAADSPVVSSPPPWALLSPLASGAAVAHGWRVADLSPVQHGSCVVTLQNARGRSHRIHLCRNDGNPQGLVYTRRVDLVVMNEGHGDLPTEEGLAQAVAELAHVVAANETTVPADCLAELLPHAERLRRYAALAAPSADGKLR